MVNVNKNIVPGKSAESSAKTEPPAPARRPRNQELNSSKKLPDSIKNRRKQKLNCSREQVIDQLVNEEQIYTQEEAEELVSSFEEQTGATVERLATPEEVEEQDGEFWATKDGRTTLWCRGNGMWYDSGISAEGDALDSSCGDKADVDSSLNCESGSAKVSGTVTIYNDFADLDNDTTERLLRSRIEKAVPGAEVDFEKVNDTDVKVKIDCPDADAEKARLAVESSDVTKSVDWESATKELDSAKDADKTVKGTTLNSSTEPEGDADGGESVGEGADLADIKITTESGNEVSMQDIKIVQNPDTNELAIFIPEDEDETIPEGFSVIGVVVPDTLGSAPAIEGGDVCPECGQDPCVCEEGSEDGGELDSSKKKNPKVESVGNGLYMYHGYTIEQSESGNSFLIEDNGEYYDFDSIDDAVEFIDDTEKQRYGSDYDEYVTQFDSSRKKNELTSESVNSSLGGGDDRQDATSQVTVPKSFPDDKVHDLYRWVESELQNEGIDVDVYGVGRPSASTISFEFEVTGRDPSEVDAIIEDRVKEFIANGNNAIQYPEGDPGHGLNSEKHEKNLNCKVENARVEPTEQGTWVVKADTDRFGKDAILYEHYSEEGANKYLDRLKAGGDAVANGYDGHIDPKKVDLDSGDGTAEAKLDKASISKAMAKVLLEDKDTPLVYVKLKDGIQAYIQPAGYEDNQLVADGNFDDANIYVAMYDADYKPVMVNGKVDNKMKGSEIVDYIRRNLGM